MNILSIETSCDETSCAIVKDGHKVLANVISSQIDLHAKTGGVVPEVAAREHVLKIIPVIDEALENAGMTFADIDAVAVTKGPGLISSLIIGTQAANAISYIKNIPLIPVQHITGHIYSNWLETDSDIKFPVLVLTVSGGHNDLILMKGHHQFKVLGETLDDAAGEAFDKVARILSLGYPGGPKISLAAKEGDPKRFKFPRAYLEKGSLNFSFSGLKTAVLTESKKHKRLTAKLKNDVAASFQEAINEVLADKVVMALNKNPQVKEVHLAGGVSANVNLREMITKKLPKNMKFRFPRSFAFCTDNAAMIASAGYYLYKKNPKKFIPKTNITPSAEFVI